jgi:hypothetical protein
LLQTQTPGTNLAIFPLFYMTKESINQAAREQLQAYSKNK